MAVDQQAFARSMQAMRKLDAVADGLVLALQQVTDATKELFGVDGGGLMLLEEDGTLSWVSVTDDIGLALEQSQQELGEGPCLSALECEGVVATPDLVRDPRWPRLALALSAHPIHGVLSIPVRLRGHVAGTLNVLCSKPRHWDGQDSRAVKAYAGVIGHLLDTAVEAHRAEQLEYTLTARILVEQAKGVLMARENLAPREAFERLRLAARASRRRVTEVAKEVLATATAVEAVAAGRTVAGEPAATGPGGALEPAKAELARGLATAASPDGPASDDRARDAVRRLVREASEQGKDESEPSR